MARRYAASLLKGKIRTMTYNISRRKLIGSTAAGIAATAIAESPAAFAQDDKPTIKVGTRPFTEHLLLGELVAQLLENDGYGVERIFNLGGAALTQEALINGDIDTLVEYTGTALIVMLEMELPERGATPEAGDSATPAAVASRSDQVYEIVKEEYPDAFGLEMLERWGFNNTYALAMRRDRAEELGVTKISDLAPTADELNIGTEAEASVRDDGVPGLQEEYDFEFGSMTTLDPGLMYTAVEQGEVDVITAYSTDGRIESMDLVLLEDDREFFPPYDAAPVVRQEVLEESPEIRDVLNQLAGKIDDASMTSMNNLADGEGMEHPDIVRDFLIEAGIIEDEG